MFFKSFKRKKKHNWVKWVSDNINLLPSLAHLNLRKHLSQENAIAEVVFRNSLTANNGVDSSISTWSGGYPQDHHKVYASISDIPWKSGNQFSCPFRTLITEWRLFEIAWKPKKIADCSPMLRKSSSHREQFLSPYVLKHTPTRFF